MERLNEKIEETLKKISEIPIDEVVTQLRDTLRSAQRLLDSGDVHGAVTNLRVTLATANRDAEARGQDDGRRGRARRRHAHDHDHRQRHGEGRSGRPSSNINRTLATVDRNVERTAETQLEAAQTLDEMRELMKSLRYLVDTLQQHPEALLQGKPEPKEKK